MAGPLTPGSRVMPLSPQDPATQLSTFKSYVGIIADPAPNIIEKKLKAAQELCESFEMIGTLPQYPQFLGDCLRVFIKILQDGEPTFITEYHNQQLRKILLEIVHRIPANDHLKPFAPSILSLMFKLLEIDNEENALVCLRIIIELNKQFRPVFTSEVIQFLKYVKDIYKKLGNSLPKIFEHRMQIKIRDMSELNIESVLDETFTSTTIVTEKKNQDNQNISYNLIPKADLSLKVLAELPIIVVLMYQLHKAQVHNEVAEFIPLIMSTINMQPTLAQRTSVTYNKEVFVDFIAAQIKTLSFLAYIIRIYQETINGHHNAMVNGMLSLLSLCPQEVAHLRKELLIAARHILATDLRTRFVSSIEKLFDENTLIGTGWTTYESLRPLAYSTLADLVHHIRQSLSLKDLALAVNLFSKNVHDESLPCSIQNMSCKLLLNLVECIRAKSEVENGNGRELFLRMLEVFVLKFKTIAETQLPYLIQKCRQQENGKACQGQSSSPIPQTTSGTSAGQQQPSLSSLGSSLMGDVKEECKTPNIGSFNAANVLGLAMDKEETKGPSKPGSFCNAPPNYSVADCRSLVKTLVSGVKTITWGISSCKAPNMDISLTQNKQFLPRETLVYIRLVEYTLQALDIYTINVSQMGQTFIRSPAGQSVRSKEEKEVLEHFAGVFIMMSPLTFKEIFATTIEYVVDRIHSNYALQLIANSFLANMATSATFATILVEYLLKRMEEMGSNAERSSLYLKLFKLVFGSVSLLAHESEQMLKPHLHTIVNRSMELARTAKDPFNYFLLLRALFRSIGGGSHDLLYQEFLPLLPTLLQGLNSLQSGLHKQYMKDLFVELCLTVPVRLSSLLPYLPMLMDPLVSALNGSQTLISQGLRTLELCVDNLQPDFLFSHIQPVRAELMQALWRCLHSSPDSTAQAAFRVLGKFGGSNRKMLQEAQKLNYNENESVGPCVTVYFQESKTPIALPVESTIEAALNMLKNPNCELFYRKQAWEVIRGFLAATMSLDEDQNLLSHLFLHPSFTDKEPQQRSSCFYRCSDRHMRSVVEKALIAMFVAASPVKGPPNSIVQFVVGLVTHYTMVALSQQAGPFALTTEKLSKMNGLDPHVLIDALAAVMGNEERELCTQGLKALSIILKVSTLVVGSKDKACQLPLFEYMAEKVSNLCYERAWYTKMGGCVMIKFFCEHMSLKWVLDHQLLFLQGLLFVIMDITGEVSNGALDMAKANVDQMLRLCSKTIPADEATDIVLEAQRKSLHEAVHELVKQITSPNQLVREQVTYTLSILSEATGKSITEIIEPHKDAIAEMVPPKKHLLRYQPPVAQIGIMEGNAFCLSLEPRFVTIDLSILEHKLFFNELHSMCDADDSLLLKLHCYKNVTTFVPLRKSAIRVLSACHYLTEMRPNIFNILYKALNSDHTELQQTAFECMKKFIAGFAIDMSMVHSAMRPLLQTLSDFSNLTLNRLHVLSSLTQLFPNSFNEKLCDQLLAHLKKWLEFSANPVKPSQPQINGQVLPNELKICAAIIEIFHLIPSASQKFLEPLLSYVLKGEKDLFIEAGSPFRQPLMKFLLRYPDGTIDLLMSDAKVQDQQWNRFFEWLLRQPDGKPFREILMNNPSRIFMLTKKGNELEFLAILIINVLVISDENWLMKQYEVVINLLNIWMSPEFHEKHRKTDSIDFPLWQEPHLLIEILLSYFKNHPGEIELLFHMLRCFTSRYIPQFQFFKEFLEETVAQTYPVDWKRQAFFKFVEIFRDPTWSQELKAKILQYVLIPCFSSSFEKDEGEKLIGGPPSPEQENSDNIISVFINSVIDPENPFGTSDAVRILVLQFSSLLVAQASHHIHDVANKKQGNKLRRLMTFAWPCLLPKTCVDPATKYHGHLLLSHIIAKFAIHKRIVLQVFHSLLKAHALEARSVVKQALEILTPAMPGRMEDGNTMLTHWTKKIIVEEGHTVAQLVHILQLIVRHFKVYYPVRHALIQHIVSSIQKLGLTPNATVEHRKLAVELAEVVIKWESQRVKEDSEDMTFPQSSKTVTEVNKPIEKHYCDTVANFLLRVACQVNEVSGSPGDLLSRRCVGLMKKALSPDVWPNCELKLGWFDKILMTVEGQQPNFGTICTALELLTFLLSILRKDMILANFKSLQRSIAACMTCPNSRVIRMVHTLLTRLMSIFPTESATSTVASKYEELECLYACVSKVVYEGLTNYEKVNNASPSQLFGTMMILKAACNHNASYIDRLITSFMRVLQRLVREHLQPVLADSAHITSELLILSLDLVKNRVGVMSPEMRKAFLGSILMGLIDKTSDAKVMKAIMKMVEDWVKNKTPLAVSQSPGLREKTVLLMKLMNNVEKRFAEDSELNAQFLELIHYLYKDESLKVTELASKLEQAFLAGLRCLQPQIRQQFVELFDNSVKKRLYDRLHYIISIQNWEMMGTHCWIKQCIELVLSIAVSGLSIQSSNPMSLLPSPTTTIQLADSHDRASFYVVTKMKEEPMDVQTVEGDEDDLDMEISHILLDDSSQPDTYRQDTQDMKQNLRMYIQKQTKFLKECRDIKTTMFLGALVQLCHNSTQLSHEVWVSLFPRAWKILSERSQANLKNMIVPFLLSGNNITQKDSYPNAVSTFVEAISHCVPPIPVRPCALEYLGKSFGLWHRVLLMLETRVAENGGLNQLTVRASPSPFDFGQTNKQETLDSLCNLYKHLKEDDMMTAVWQKRARYHDMAVGLAYEQHGLFEQAQQSYLAATDKVKSDLTSAPANPADAPEFNLMMERYLRCSKELGEWENLLTYATGKGIMNPQLVLECAWRLPKTNWGLMKDALTQVEQSCPKEIAWKVNLYRGYLTICAPEEHHLTMLSKQIERLVEASSSLAIKEWRHLPRIVSQAHVALLQASQLIIELQEASALSVHIQPTNVTRDQSMHDMKAIVKTWRNRLPMIADDLSHWSDVFTWREHQFQMVANAYESITAQDQNATNHSLFGIHHTAIGMVHFGRIARKHSLINVALNSLSKIHAIASVPVVDCFHKIRQQVKCYLQMAGTVGKAELQEGLDVIETTNLKYFTKEMSSEFFALKGTFFSYMGRSEDAYKSFSAAAQISDAFVKAWALWGDYLETLFTRDRNISTGLSAMVCFLHACRNQNEGKSRKYLAKVLWLLTYDDEKLTLTECVDKYGPNIPPMHWLPWIPQLLSCLVRNEGRLILNLLSKIGSLYPQAVYFPIRTLYLTLKIEQRERCVKPTEQSFAHASSASGQGTETLTASSVPATSVAGSLSAAVSAVPESSRTSSQVEAIGQPQVCTSGSTSTSAAASTAAAPTSADFSGPIRATTPMWRCSRVMHVQRDNQTTVLSSLEGIVDQMVWFRENWHEEVLRQLRQGLAKCYAVAFENRASVSEAAVTPHTLNFMRKLVQTFGVGVDTVSSVTTTYSSAASESLARRVQATAEDPIFQRMKNQFTVDFDFSIPGSTKLHNLINRLKKWIKILEAKIKVLPGSFLLEERCRFLSTFSLSTAEVELPGEFLIPKHGHYYVKIERFLPRVDIVHKHSAAARRLYIRGHNGKVYPYLIVNDACMTESRREERVLQLLRFLNHFLIKQKETNRRQLHFVVPRVIPFSPQMRFVEDNPASISLLDIYKQKINKGAGEHDIPIARYYERLATIQARGSQPSHQVLCDILKEVQANMVPRQLLKEWAQHRFPDATDYWTFRKNITNHLAIWGFAEFILHLTRMNPDMMYLHQDSGFMNVSYFKFDTDDQSGDLNANRPVPFRLTPNLAEFLTQIGITGPLTASMVAAARCFVYPSYKLSSYLSAILRDEYITWHKKKQEELNLGGANGPPDLEGEVLIQMVTKAVQAIITRLQNLAVFEGAETRVSTLIAAANSPDNLCRMDPAWHPWL